MKGDDNDSVPMGRRCSGHLVVGVVVVVVEVGHSVTGVLLRSARVDLRNFLGSSSLVPVVNPRIRGYPGSKVYMYIALYWGLFELPVHYEAWASRLNLVPIEPQSPIDDHFRMHGWGSVM